MAFADGRMHAGVPNTYDQYGINGVAGCDIGNFIFSQIMERKALSEPGKSVAWYGAFKYVVSDSTVGFLSSGSADALCKVLYLFSECCVCAAAFRRLGQGNGPVL